MAIKAIVIDCELVVPVAKASQVQQVLVYVNFERLLEYLADSVLLFLDPSALKEGAEELFLLLSVEALPFGIATSVTALRVLVLWVIRAFKVLLTVHHLNVVEECKSRRLIALCSLFPVRFEGLLEGLGLLRLAALHLWRFILMIFPFVSFHLLSQHLCLYLPLVFLSLVVK